MGVVYGLNAQPEDSYPNVEALDGFDAPIPALNPINDGGTGWSGRNGGVPVDGTHFPKKLRYTHARRRPPADFESSPEITVSERAKAVIEEMEKGVHQFFPVDFINNKGEQIERRYWLVVCNRIDSVSREHTTMVLRKGKVWRPVRDLVRRGEPIPAHLPPTTKSKIVFDLAAISRAHMWKDKHLDGGGIWISEAMATRLQAEKLGGLDWGRHGLDAI